MREKISRPQGVELTSGGAAARNRGVLDEVIDHFVELHDDIRNDSMAVRAVPYLTVGDHSERQCRPLANRSSDDQRSTT